MELTPGSGGHSHAASELTGEVVGIGEAALEGGLGDSDAGLPEQFSGVGKADANYMFQGWASHDRMEGSVERGIGHAGPAAEVGQGDTVRVMRFDVAKEFTDGLERLSFRTSGTEITAGEKEEKAHQFRHCRKTVAGVALFEFRREFRDHCGGSSQIVGWEMETRGDAADVAQARLHPEERLIAGHFSHGLDREAKATGVEEDVDQRHALGIGVPVGHFATDEEDVARGDRIVSSFGQVAATARQNDDEFMEVMAVKLRRFMRIVAANGQRKAGIGEHRFGRDGFHG